MSPDEQVVRTLVRQAARRVRLLAMAEGVALGIAAAAGSRVAGFVAAVVYIAWRWQDSRRDSVVDAAERSHPELRNHLITWNEIAAGTLDATRSARDRVMVATASRATRIDLARVFPATDSQPAAVVQIVLTLIALAFLAVMTHRPANPSNASRDPARSSVALVVLLAPLGALP